MFHFCTCLLVKANCLDCLNSLFRSHTRRIDFMSSTVPTWLLRCFNVKAFFVVREKHKMVSNVMKDKSYNNPNSGVMADQIIRFTGNKTKKNYPVELRRVVFYDSNGNRTFLFYTNNLDVTAEEVALLYKFRWRCELFLNG